MSQRAPDAHAIAIALVDLLRPMAARVSAARTLSAGKISILRHLAAHGRATTAELALVVRVSPQAVSLAAKELQGVDLIAREPDDEDRRKGWLVLTELGRQRLEEELLVSSRWLEEAVSTRLSPAEASVVADVVPLLRRLVSEPDA